MVQAVTVTAPLPEPEAGDGADDPNDSPALKQLLADVEAGQIDVIVVYKVDRLSRSLLDFVKVMERLNAAGASFVSVTQNFSTADAMGRLTMNMLMSFAEFEREMISERTRDKIAASRRRGKWTGGPTPFGYKLVEKKLVVDDVEAHVFGQGLSDAGERGVDAREHLEGVGLDEHLHHDVDGLSLSVRRCRAYPRSCAHDDLGDIADPNRNALSDFDDASRKLLRSRGPCDTAEQHARFAGLEGCSRRITRRAAGCVGEHC